MILVSILLIGAFALSNGQNGFVPVAVTETPGPPTPGTFMVVAPRVVRPGRPYAVSLNVLDSKHSDLVVRLEIRDSNNNTLASKVTTGVGTNAPQTVRIENVPADRLLSGGRYLVYVRGETVDGNVQFEKQEPVDYDQKSLSIFVQTDKAIYKPGATVNFRAVVVNPDLRPYTDTISLKIKDPNDNTIKLLREKTLTKGVYTDSLEVAADPPLGDWRIEVETKNGIKFMKTFSVEKYVLPKFEVKIEPPSFVTRSDDVTVLIKAKYTYGKGVEGAAKVVVRHPWRWQWRQEGPGQVSEIHKQIDLNNMGEASVTVRNAELQQAQLIDSHGSSQYEFIVTVTEALTGIERNATHTVMAHKSDVILELKKAADNFKPGLTFSYLVTVKQPDDTSLPASRPRKVQLKTMFHYPYDPTLRESPSDNDEVIIDLETDGTKLMQITPPLNASTLRVEARYDRSGDNNFAKSEIYSSLYVDAAKSPSVSYLQLKKQDISKTSVNVGETIRFSVKVTETVPAVTMQIMSRGVMLESRVLTMTGDSIAITVTATAEMAPKARLVVYAVRDENKEILVDAMDFKVEGLFRNKVSVSTDRAMAKPGEPVTVKVTADADSFVGLLAVDKSVLLLKSGNDITAQMVEEDIERYDTAGHHGWGRPWPMFRGGGRRRKRSFFPWWGIGGKDAKSIFENAGLIVLTDALLFSEPLPPIVFKATARGGGGVGGGMRPEAVMDRTDGGASTGEGTKIKVRQEFSETWIWHNVVDVSDNGTVTHEAKVPDTITSWITSAFAIHDTSGLGVAPTTAELKVFQPFFVRLNLPYSVKRGEKLALQVLVFNYMETEQTVEVTLKHGDNSGFDFVEKSGEPMKKDAKNKFYNMRRVTVRGGGGSRAVFFPIVPTKIGEVMLEVTGRGDQAGDTVRMPLKVEPEGYRVDRNVPVVIELEGETSAFEKQVRMEFPPDAVPGSQTAKFDIIGDLMGPVMNNIEGLVRMPYGCGEQNMLGFVPNIVVMKYLNATQRDDVQLKGKAVKFMESGYQRELTYKHNDHSYSAFGERDDHGSTWLTAFVVRSFKQASEFIFVDEEKLTASIGYLQEQQKENGAFGELGEVHHKDMQGGAAEGGVPMTAYVVVALLENGVTNREAINYLEQSLPSIADEPYALAVVTYALHLADSAQKDEALRMLEAKQVSEHGTVHWEDKVNDEEREGETRYFYQPKPVNVEMTSYALLSYMLRRDTDKGLPIVRWLTNQRNAYGGFSSTQDTVMALQALSEYASLAYSPTFAVDVEVQNGGSTTKRFNVGPQNSIVLQSAELTQLDSPVMVKATGNGVIFGQVQYQYYMTKKRSDVPFECDRQVIQPDGPIAGKPSNRLILSVCCKYTKGGKSNMALFEADALSGHQFEADEINALTSLPGLQRVELEKGDTHTNIYLNPMGEDRVCMNMTTQRVFQVADQKPANARLYDYYDPKLEVKMDYTSKQTQSMQSMCTDCWDNLVTEETRNAESSDERAGALEFRCSKTSQPVAANNKLCADQVDCRKTAQLGLCNDAGGHNRMWLRQCCAKTCDLCDDVGN